jgi:hypothetical protein
MIREEIANQNALEYERLDKLPVLDSFINESVRANPLDKCKLTLTRGDLIKENFG